MLVETYKWPAHDQFRNRTAELETLTRWWESDSVEPVSMWGRRRVGKSWLFREFAHGRTAVILVADRVSAGLQLDRMSRALEPMLGLRPRLDDIGDLITVLYRMARDQKVLVVIDEFPYLLGTSAADQNAALSQIQAAMEEERDESRIKLVLAGSTVATMLDLQAERNPLHGRTRPFEVKPLRFAHARLLMDDISNPIAQMTRFSIAGGMPRYLTALSGQDQMKVLADQVFDPAGPLFNEPRSILASELREPAMYFSILSALAVKPATAAEVATKLRLESRDLATYLQTLERLRLVTRHEPVGSKSGSRGLTRWRCDDDFIRFWFRFVQPSQPDLESGADPRAFVRRWVEPLLADHAAPTFERVVADWMRRRYIDLAPRVGSWWGHGLHSLRKTGERSSEEVDVVVLDDRRVVGVAEAKWTNKPLTADVLRDLENYKLPALAQAGLPVSGAEIVLASRSGFTDGVVDLAVRRGHVHLIEASDLLSEL